MTLSTSILVERGCTALIELLDRSVRVIKDPSRTVALVVERLSAMGCGAVAPGRAKSRRGT
jgi:hypothetical protein